MKKTMLSILLLNAFLFSQNQPSLTPEEIYKNSLPSIMILNVINKDGSEMLGTGFLAFEDGIAVTSYHVIKNAVQVTAKFFDGEVFDVSGIIDKDELRDIALVRVKVFGKQQLRLLSTEPEIGNKAFIIGAPLGLEFSVSDGIISQVQTFNNIKNYQFSCPASPGNSGGPLLNSNGEVIGVVYSGSREGQNLNFAIPSYYVLGLDRSLPTTPFSITSSAVITNSTKEVNRKLFPKGRYFELLAESLTDYYDLNVMINYLTRIQYFNLHESNYFFGEYTPAYTFPFPSEYYSILREIQYQFDEFSSLIFNEEELSEINSIYIKHLENIIKGAEYLEDSIEEARRRNGWTPQSNELLSKSKSYLTAQSNQYVFNKRLDKYLSESNDFLSLTNDEIKILFNAIEGYSDFKLGIFYISRQPAYIYFVGENTLAEKLKLKSRDIILSYDSREFDGFVNFKIYLYENRGKEIAIKVRRENKIKEFKVNIPSNFIIY